MNTYNGFTHAQRMRAYRWAQREYKAGRKARHAACQACGQDQGLIMGHSEDYSEPYGPHIGRWGLCYRCHMMIHCREKSPEVFDRYRREVAAGFVFAAFPHMNWPGFRAEHLIRWAPRVDRLGDRHPDVFTRIIAEGQAVSGKEAKAQHTLEV